MYNPFNKGEEIMKKFYFPLHTVLNYKQQVLDNLRNEQAQIIDRKSVV